MPADDGNCSPLFKLLSPLFSARRQSSSLLLLPLRRSRLNDHQAQETEIKVRHISFMYICVCAASKIRRATVTTGDHQEAPDQCVRVSDGKPLLPLTASHTELMSLRNLTSHEYLAGNPTSTHELLVLNAYWQIWA